MRVVDEGLQLVVRAEVRVDAGEVGDPVAVVPGARVLALALDGLVHEARRQPDRVRAESRDVVEVRAQACDVAAVVEAARGRVEPGGEAVAGEAAGVVRGVAVGEPVGHDEVELLAVAGLAHGRGDDRVVGSGVPGCQGVGLDRDAVRGVVVDEAERGRSGDGERDVRSPGRAVGAVALVPRTVQGDLVLVRARRHVERARVLRGAVDRFERGRGARGIPVAGASQLALQVADERGHAIGGEGGRGSDGDGAGPDEDGGGEQRERAPRGGGQGRRRLRHAELPGCAGTAPCPEQVPPTLLGPVTVRYENPLIQP